MGFDDVMLSKLVTPELTTISQPIEDIGRTASKEYYESIKHRFIKY